MIANGLMETVNDLYSVWSTELGQSDVGRDIKEKLILLIAPVAPHLAEELWEGTGHEGHVVLAAWPEFDEKLAAAETLTIVVQVNGKLRDRLDVDRGITEEEAKELALASPAVIAQMDGKQLRRVIYVPGRLVNLVAG
jgi:leucyl-tRNA synthetase